MNGRGKKKFDCCGRNSVVSRKLKIRIRACAIHRATFEEERQLILSAPSEAHFSSVSSDSVSSTHGQLPDDIVFATPLRSASAPPAPFSSSPAPTPAKEKDTESFLRECDLLDTDNVKLSYDDVMEELSNHNQGAFSLENQQPVKHPPVRLFPPNISETVKRFPTCRFKIPPEEIKCSVSPCSCDDAKVMLMTACQHLICANCYLRWKPTMSSACPTCDYEYGVFVMHRVCE